MKSSRRYSGCLERHFLKCVRGAVISSNVRSSYFELCKPLWVVLYGQRGYICSQLSGRKKRYSQNEVSFFVVSGNTRAVGSECCKIVTYYSMLINRVILVMFRIVLSLNTGATGSYR
eukprot:Rmarinus@m.12753